MLALHKPLGIPKGESLGCIFAYFLCIRKYVPERHERKRKEKQFVNLGAKAKKNACVFKNTQAFEKSYL